ncbi:MAG: tetratricopeptide repeat-containing serine/threonine-protein kinase, partial [Planctomycetota bacterium]|nr:tetratricopeptide repeat-containing serine/threonine-protein kinase [Planctomycetota bacterium]
MDEQSLTESLGKALREKSFQNISPSLSLKPEAFETASFKENYGPSDDDPASSQRSSNGNAVHGHPQLFLKKEDLAKILTHPNILVNSSSERALKSQSSPSARTWSEALNHDPDNLHSHLSILLSLCDALRYAHSKSVLHLDLKTDHILLGEFGEVYLCHWELAHNLENTNPIVRPRGTPAHMSPEQVSPHNGQIGMATDIFLLGAILHMILAKRPIHSEQGFIKTLLEANRYNGPSLNESIPEALRSCCHKALQRNPEDRHKSVAEFQNQLQNSLAKQPQDIPQAKPLKSLSRSIIIGIGVTIALLFLTVQMKLNKDLKQRLEQAQAKLEESRTQNQSAPKSVPSFKEARTQSIGPARGVLRAQTPKSIQLGLRSLVSLTKKIQVEMKGPQARLNKARKAMLSQALTELAGLVHNIPKAQSEDLELLTAKTVMAQIRGEQKKVSEALKLYQDVEAAYRKIRSTKKSIVLDRRLSSLLFEQSRIIQNSNATRAIEMQREAMELTQEVIPRLTGDQQRSAQTTLAKQLINHGQLLLRESQLSKSLKVSLKARSIVNGLSEGRQAEPLALSTKTHCNLANVFQALKRKKDAQRHYELALEKARQLRDEARKDSAGLVLNLLRQYGEFSFASEQFNKARALAFETADLLEQWLRDEAMRGEIVESLGDQYAMLGDIYLRQRQFKNAERELQKALKYFSTRESLGPINDALPLKLSRTEMRLSGIYKRRRDAKAELKLLNSAMKRLQGLALKRPKNLDALLALALTERALGSHYQRSRHWETALEKHRSALARIQRLLERNSKNTDLQFQVLESQFMIAQFYVRRRQFKDAKTSYFLYAK